MKSLERLTAIAFVLTVIGILFYAYLAPIEADYVDNFDPNNITKDKFLDRVSNSPGLIQEYKLLKERKWYEFLSRQASKGLQRVRWQTDTIDTPLGKQIQSPYRELIYAHASEYGVSGDDLTKIIECESGFNPLAKNPKGSAKGLAQIIDATFASTPQGKAGRSRFEADANIAAAAWLMKAQGTRPWDSSKKCWSD